MSSRPIRWGVISTARIARTAFLPAVRAAGHTAVVVGGRDLDRTRQFAEANEVERAVQGYEAVIEADDVDAVYNPLPNGMHGEWTIKALRAGKAVLCEKPLCGDLTEARSVLSVAETAEQPLWEAFVFPFHRQQRRLQALVRSGAIGEVREVQSQFHFGPVNEENVRLIPELAGGALNDVGCYPVRFTQILTGAEPKAAVAVSTSSDRGVDLELQGVLEFSKSVRLLISCGMLRDSGTYSRVIGMEGEIRITNPFHARQHDTIEICSGGSVAVESLGVTEPTFAEALRHIGGVLHGDERPIHTALQDSLSTEIGLDLLRRGASTGRRVESA